MTAGMRNEIEASLGLPLVEVKRRMGASVGYDAAPPSDEEAERRFQKWWEANLEYLRTQVCKPHVLALARRLEEERVQLVLFVMGLIAAVCGAVGVLDAAIYVVRTGINKLCEEAAGA